MLQQDDTISYYCKHIGKSLDFGVDSLHHCCFGFGAKEMSKICSFNGGVFPINQYLNSMCAYSQKNTQQRGGCAGCVNLTSGTPDINFSSFSYISLNNFTRCHLRCVYCQLGLAEWRKTFTSWPYELVPVLQNMYDNKYLDEKTLVAWGGGEPTLYEHFDDTVRFIISKKIRQHIDTNAVMYSESIANALSTNLAVVRVSVDSGIRETYKKIKGADFYESVWDNIKAYNKVKGISLKYVFTDQNSNEHDVLKFVESCLNNGIMDIYLSPEIHSYHYGANITDTGTIQKDNHCVEAARILYKQAIMNGIKPHLIIWKKQDIEKITNH